jgi:hypothetical protein
MNDFETLFDSFYDYMHLNDPEFINRISKKLKKVSTGIVLNGALIIVHSHRLSNNTSSLIKFIKKPQWSNMYVGIVVNGALIIVGLYRLSNSITSLINFIKEHQYLENMLFSFISVMNKVRVFFSHHFRKFFF